MYKDECVSKQFKSLKLETTKMPNDRVTKIYKVACSHSGILHSSEKEQATATCIHVGEYKKHTVEIRSELKTTSSVRFNLLKAQNQAKLKRHWMTRVLFC